MSWRDRVNGAVLLASPNGQLFERGLWIGDPREKEKHLGVFLYPGAKGALVQDLGRGPVKYPLTITFEGPDHDIEAQRFWNACDETGVWGVLHPTKGGVDLQLVNVKEDIQPVTAGNTTAFSTEWLEVGLDIPAVTISALEDECRGWVYQYDDTAAVQFREGVQATPTMLGRLKATVDRVIARMNALKASVAGITATVTTVAKTVQGIIADTVLSTAALASALRTLIRLPGDLIRDTGARFAYYEHILAGAVTLCPTDAEPAGVNAAAVAELVTAAALGGLALAVVDAQFSTREEALTYLERYEQAWTSATDQLDRVQALYADRAVDKQYFSQQATYPEAVEVLRMVRALVLRRSFDLATAKRVTLQRDRSPLEVALTYGVDYDTLLTANGLKGDDILLLPAGREVVIYR